MSGDPRLHTITHYLETKCFYEKSAAARHAPHLLAALDAASALDACTVIRWRRPHEFRPFDGKIWVWRKTETEEPWLSERGARAGFPSDAIAWAPVPLDLPWSDVGAPSQEPAPNALVTRADYEKIVATLRAIWLAMPLSAEADAEIKSCIDDLSDSTWHLSEKDSRAFIDALENPPEPNDALKTMAAQHKKQSPVTHAEFDQLQDAARIVAAEVETVASLPEFAHLPYHWLRLDGKPIPAGWEAIDTAYVGRWSFADGVILPAASAARRGYEYAWPCYPDAAERIAALEAQLPDGMRDCTIRFLECEVGHGRLTATNWVQHGCSQCRIVALEAALLASAEALNAASHELFCADRAIGALECQNAAAAAARAAAKGETR